MPTYQTRILNEIGAGHDGPPIHPATLAYFQERFRGRIHDFILGRFINAQKGGLNQAKLGRRIGKKAEVINRWLASPSNLTSDTISDLLIGIAAEELTLGSASLLNRDPVNISHLDEVPSGANAVEELTQDREKIASALDNHRDRNASALDDLKSLPQQDDADTRVAA
jgi:hypothetical protein